MLSSAWRSPCNRKYDSMRIARHIFGEKIKALLWRARWHRQAEAWSGVSRSACEILQQELPKLEAIFLEVSNHLEPVTVESQKLVEECEALLRLASGIDSGKSVLHRTAALLKGPLEYIDRCVEEEERLLRRIDECTRCAGAMLTVRSDILRSLAPLTQVAVLFKIESSRLSAELRETFVTVTTEIERMHSSVHESMDGNASHLERAIEALAKIRTTLVAEFAAIAKNVSEKKSAITAAIASLDSQLTANAARDTRLHGHSRFVRDEVSRIVGSLQFQDIVQQKCQHILEALNDPTDRVGHHAALQAGHIAGVVQDLTLGQATILQSLDDLAAQSEDLERSSIRLDDLQGMTAASDGIVQMLLDALSTVRSLTGEVATLTDSTYSALTPLTSLATNLSSALSDTAVNMNHIALNAQIRSIISGEGTGLEQLSARAAQISSEVNTLSQTNAHNLQLLDESVSAMLATFSEFKESGKAALASYDAGRGDIESELHQIRDETLEAFKALGSTLASLHENFLQIRSGAEQIGTLIEPISTAGQLLSKFREENKTVSQEFETINEHARVYTMESEKEVHAQVTGTSLGAEKRSMACPSGNADGAPTFEDFTRTTETDTVAAGAQPISAGDNFELL